MTDVSEPKLRIGVLSDIHITDDASTAILRTAFEWFRDRHVDGVLIAGDMADQGRLDQLLRVRKTWDAVFPGDRLPEGGKVEKLFVYGNHDVAGWEYNSAAFRKAHPELFAPSNNIGADRAGAWRKAWDEDYAPIYLKRVKGFAFVGAHFESWKVQHIPGLDQFLADHAGELQGPQPFFYFQHMHPKGTCSAPWTWGQDDGQVTRALSKFPNCVALSGHSHTSLTDDRTIRQGDFGFTSVGTASLRYIIPFGGRENSSAFGAPRVEGRQMPDLLASGAARKVHQGMLMNVFGDRIVFERRDFSLGAALGPDWVVPLGGYGALTYETRASKAPVPKLPKGAVVAWKEAPGKTREGKSAAQVTVSFPPARSMDAARAFDYEVTARATEGGLSRIVCRKRVFSPAYWSAECAEPPTVACVFAKDELPWNLKFVFAVRPMNCFGVKGPEVVSKACKLKVEGTK